MILITLLSPRFRRSFYVDRKRDGIINEIHKNDQHLFTVSLSEILQRNSEISRKIGEKEKKISDTMRYGV